MGYGTCFRIGRGFDTTRNTHEKPLFSVIENRGYLLFGLFHLEYVFNYRDL